MVKRWALIGGTIGAIAILSVLTVNIVGYWIKHGLPKEQIPGELLAITLSSAIVFTVVGFAAGALLGAALAAVVEFFS